MIEMICGIRSSVQGDIDSKEARARHRACVARALRGMNGNHPHADAGDIFERCTNASKQSRTADAVRLCTQAVNARPLTPSIRAAVYLGRAKAYFQTGQYAKAEADYSEAIASTYSNAPDPGGASDEEIANTRAIALVMRGHCRAEQGNSSAAVKDFTDALAYERLDRALRVRAYVWRGEIYASISPNAAIADYSHAIALAPNDWPSWEGRALAYATLCQVEAIVLPRDKALAECAHAISDIEHARRLHAISRANIASVYRTTSEAKLVIAHHANPADTKLIADASQDAARAKAAQP
jgi:tetratricopeptide (TPR) repeat protein